MPTSHINLAKAQNKYQIDQYTTSTVAETAKWAYKLPENASLNVKKNSLVYRQKREVMLRSSRSDEYQIDATDASINREVFLITMIETTIRFKESSAQRAKKSSNRS